MKQPVELTTSEVHTLIICMMETMLTMQKDRVGRDVPSYEQWRREEIQRIGDLMNKVGTFESMWGLTRDE